MKILRKLRIEVIRQFNPLIQTAKRKSKAAPPVLQTAVSLSVAARRNGGSLKWF